MKGVIFSHVKVTCYFHMWRYEVFARKLTWYFIGLYIIKHFTSCFSRIFFVKPKNMSILILVTVCSFFAQTGPPVSWEIHTRGHIFFWKCKSWSELLGSVSINENQKSQKLNFLRWDLCQNIISKEEAFGINDTLGELINTAPSLLNRFKDPHNITRSVSKYSGFL